MILTVDTTVVLHYHLCLQVFNQLSDKWELLHYDTAAASNPEVEKLLKAGAGSNAAECGQVGHTLGLGPYALAVSDTYVLVQLGTCR
jgi:hypothetical protein